MSSCRSIVAFFLLFCHRYAILSPSKIIMFIICTYYHTIIYHNIRILTYLLVLSPRNTERISFPKLAAFTGSCLYRVKQNITFIHFWNLVHAKHTIRMSRTVKISQPRIISWYPLIFPNQIYSCYLPGSDILCKKRLSIFLSPARMLLTKLSLARNNNCSRPGEFGLWHPGWVWKIR